VQKALDLDPNDQILREEEAVYVQVFNEAKLDEERFLKQKAKIEWLEIGDSNSVYFLKAVKSKNQRGRIDIILNYDIVKVLCLSVSNAFDMSYSDMVHLVLDNEIKAAMFDIGDDRAPSPDGFTYVFFKKGWDIVGKDVCNAIQDVFSNRRLLKEIKDTFIALIPKILTNRIIEGIKEVVSANQSVFVLERQISNNILITQELMLNHHRNRGPPRCAFKVDIQKAYDMVYWGFLVNHVKIAILNIRPFSEGELPVKYLGVPFISSRILNKDCTILVEKVKNRIGD
ncbi:hypothetical protein Tco_1524188, partial [Tanacetum coccineum]